MLTSSEAASFPSPLGRILRDLERALRQRIDAHIAEQDVGIGDRRLRAAALVGAGPGRAPAERGPTSRRPSGFFAAMDPPPAPISIIWIDWILSGNRLAEALVVRNFEVGADGRLAVRDRQSLAVVLPMSKDNTLASPAVLPNSARRPRRQPALIQSDERHPAARRLERGRRTRSSTHLPAIPLLANSRCKWSTCAAICGRV